jgi:8-oxo-dGTP diphosphatase
VEQQRALVVGTAILRDGRVLAARRSRPAGAAGRWELPGGKVEPGEDAAQAAVREVAEELRCTVAVTGMLAGEQPVGSRWVLRVAVAELTGGEPVPTEHDAVRWLGPDHLHDVEWLGPDLPFLTELGEILSGRARPGPVSRRVAGL